MEIIDAQVHLWGTIQNPKVGGMPLEICPTLFRPRAAPRSLQRPTAVL
jgi:hypothetical protein